VAAARKASEQTQAVWRKMNYSDITEPAFMQAFLARLDSPSVGLTSAQRKQVESLLTDILRYLHEPVFEDYLRLKTEGARFSFVLSEAARVLQSGSQPGGLAETSSEPLESLRVVWNAVYLEQVTNRPSRIDAVCLDNVSAAISTTNSGWSLLSGPVAKGMTVAEEATEPGFNYPAITENASQPACLFLDLSFYAKVKESGNAGPIYLSFAWSDADQRWLPNRLIADAWLRMKRTLF
jgi:hypothetical protein